ncbi:MAG: hypothetical protein GY931_06210 [Maribacter sp.]|nr:hypothetical protein [Maribacter sp.]
MRFRDNRVVSIGLTHEVKGSPELLTNGLHASVKVLNALRSATSCNLFIVDLGGEIVKSHDWFIATERTYLKSHNIEKTLKEFARKWALINVEDIMSHCSGVEYELILNFLNSGDEGLRLAARSAARSAVDSAPGLSAAHSAWASTHSNTLFSARSAVDSDNWWPLTHPAANEMLTEMIHNETGWDRIEE